MLYIGFSTNKKRFFAHFKFGNYARGRTSPMNSIVLCLLFACLACCVLSSPPIPLNSSSEAEVKETKINYINDPHYETAESHSSQEALYYSSTDDLYDLTKNGAVSKFLYTK